MLTTIFVEAGASGGDGSANAPFGAIQDAVDSAAASPGADKIMIRAGEYAENVAIEDDDALTLNGQGNVTIKHPTIDVAGGEEPEDVVEAEGDVTFRNLNIEGLFIGDDVGGRGIDAKDGSFTFHNIRISGTDGDALRVRDFGDLVIRNGNFSSLDADGIDIEDGGSMHVSNTNASNNEDEGLEVDRVDSVSVLNSTFTGNGDDGVDVDDSTDIRIVNVVSTGNAGNGFQVEAEKRDVERIVVIGSYFADNDESGVEIVDTDPVSIAILQLFGNESNSNSEFGYDIDISGAVIARGNRAADNGDNTLP